MLIRNYPFIPLGSSAPRPMLWIRIFNPDIPNVGIQVLAIVDTGADNCSFPPPVAIQLGHVFESVQRKPIETAAGITYAYPHTTSIQIMDQNPDGTCGSNVLYTIPRTLVDYTIGCKAFLLGRTQFLNKFVLKIDYPRQVFSIRRPEPKKKKRKKKKRH